MVSGELCLAADNDFLANNMKEMIGGCCVCSDERGWAENPLVYCDGHGCNVAVHQACYGIVQVPTGPWFCRKCESQERAARVRCELCPHKDGALKRTDNGGKSHLSRIGVLCVTDFGWSKNLSLSFTRVLPSSIGTHTQGCWHPTRFCG
ncbi:unnamed protein product [Oncorhynchus mykiss]|uniref:PHD-type domain-containing protein n=1 Tax=Oncorhynchus mykiss TaxID=8022 RepID=A0A060Y2V1_ONCMY|nr:unnamed protein product [Oncorhynchus mykiss]